MDDHAILDNGLQFLENGGVPFKEVKTKKINKPIKM